MSSSLFSRIEILFRYAVICGICVMIALPAVAQNAESEQNYERFKVVFRQSNATDTELRNALTFLETANLLAPGVYKYVFGVGAVNLRLKNWAEAVEWLTRALLLTADESQRDTIRGEVKYCQDKLDRMIVASRPRETIMRFALKGGVSALRQDLETPLPKALPVVRADADMGTLVDLLKDSFADSRRRAGSRERFNYLAKPPFLIVGSNFGASPKDIYEKGIADIYRHFMQEYFDKSPDRAIVTVISPEPDELSDATEALYEGVEFPVYAPFLGYYNRADNLIMATGGSVGYGTLAHEMVHALMAADFPEAPAWLDEGLASLYERTQWRSGRIEGLPNWRMNSMRAGQMPSLQELAEKARDLNGRSVEIGEIRLLLLFLDQSKKVDDLYRMVKEAGEAFSLEDALVELGLVEDDWRAFLETTFREYGAEMALNRGAIYNRAEVRFLQYAFNEIIGTSLNVDGIWGPSTRDALIEFQRFSGLDADGIAGPATMAELRRRYTLARVDSL